MEAASFKPKDKNKGAIATAHNTDVDHKYVLKELHKSLEICLFLVSETFNWHSSTYRNISMFCGLKWAPRKLLQNNSILFKTLRATFC